MNENNYISRIEAYLGNQMADPERQAFENDLESDPALSQAMKKYEIARQAVDLLSEDALRTKFSEWRKEGKKKEATPATEQEPKAEQPKKNRLRTVWVKRLAIAAGILFILVGIWHFVGKPPSSSDERIAIAHLRPPEFTGENTKSSQEANILAAIDEYEKKDYDGTINILRDMDPSEVRAYILAYAYFQQREYALAEQYFRQLAEWEDTSYTEEAEGGLLLALLAQGKTNDEFSSLMGKIIANNGHFYHEEAREVQEQLKLGKE